VSPGSYHQMAQTTSERHGSSIPTAKGIELVQPPDHADGITAADWAEYGHLPLRDV
jgi:hypothetical protein